MLVGLLPTIHIVICTRHLSYIVQLNDDIDDVVTKVLLSNLSFFGSYS